METKKIKLNPINWVIYDEPIKDNVVASAWIDGFLVAEIQQLLPDVAAYFIKPFISNRDSAAANMIDAMANYEEQITKFANKCFFITDAN